LTSFHNNSDSGNEIGRLLTDFGRLVIQTPQNGAANLWQIRLDAFAEGVDDRPEPVQHHYFLHTTIRKQTIIDVLNALLRILHEKLKANYSLDVDIILLVDG